MGVNKLEFQDVGLREDTRESFMAAILAFSSFSDKPTFQEKTFLIWYCKRPVYIMYGLRVVGDNL
jgi:hypothetical protein